MDSSKKNKIIIISVLVIAAAIYVMFALVLSGKNPNDNLKPKYLMIDNNLLWQKKNNTWVQLNAEPEDFYDNNLTLYYGNDKITDVIVQKSNGNLFYFDKNYNQLKFDDARALTTNLDLKFADFEILSATDSDQIYIDEAIKMAKAENQGTYKTKKISYDFDNDGSLETLYVTNNFVFDIVDYNFYSMFYMVKNNKISQMIASNDMPYDFIEILDIDSDDVYEIIMSYDVKNIPSFTSCYQLYDYNNEKWTIIKNCS